MLLVSAEFAISMLAVSLLSVVLVLSCKVLNEMLAEVSAETALSAVVSAVLVLAAADWMVLAVRSDVRL